MNISINIFDALILLLVSGLLIYWVKDLVSHYYDKKGNIEANQIYPHLKERISILEAECLDRTIIIASLTKRLNKILQREKFNNEDYVYLEKLQQHCLENFKDANADLSKIRHFKCKWLDGTISTIFGKNFASAFKSNYLEFEMYDLDTYSEISYTPDAENES